MRNAKRIKLSDFIIIYSTFSEKQKAKECVKALIDEGLCACANILGEIESIYKWNNKIEESKEIAVIFKTVSKNYELVENRLKQLHDYETPCIIAFNISKGSQEFLNWITSNTTIPL